MSEGKVSARWAGVLLAVLAFACRSAREGDELARPEPDRTGEYAILRERLDRLARQIETLNERQTARLLALELRAKQLEDRQLAVERGSAEADAIRKELVQLRSDVVALGAEEELDRMYRERVERLERAFQLVERAGDPGHSITDIWTSYVSQRDEIQRLGEQLNGGAQP
jgi:hypothetical protein